MIDIRKSKLEDAKLLGYDLSNNFNPLESSKFCFTLIKDDQYLAMFGSIEVNNGTHRLWLILNKEGKRYPLLYTKTVKAALGNIRLLDPATRRVELTVRDDFKSGKDWAEMLGFVKEGLLHNYDPEDSMDHVIYYLPEDKWNG